MRIRKKTQAGTLQSSDLIVFVEPADTLEVEIESTVQQQFGAAWRNADIKLAASAF